MIHDSQFDEHIFRRGWNHQLEKTPRKAVRSAPAERFCEAIHFLSMAAGDADTNATVAGALWLRQAINGNS